MHSERLPSLRAALVSTPFKREREQTLAELGKVLSSFQVRPLRSAEIKLSRLSAAMWLVLCAGCTGMIDVW